MVIDALKNIPSHFSIEIPHGQFHQFAQKVGDEGNVDSCSQVQQIQPRIKFTVELLKVSISCANKTRYT